MEQIREELHKLIEVCNYNLTDARVIEKSQELDRELNKKDPLQRVQIKTINYSIYKFTK